MTLEACAAACEHCLMGACHIGLPLLLPMRHGIGGITPIPQHAAPLPALPAVTHAHPDHVGALPQLLEAFPDTPVLIHGREKEFLLEGKLYFPPNPVVDRLAQWAGLAGSEPLKVRFAGCHCGRDAVHCRA